MQKRVRAAVNKWVKHKEDATNEFKTKLADMILDKLAELRDASDAEEEPQQRQGAKRKRTEDELVQDYKLRILSARGRHAAMTEELEAEERPAVVPTIYQFMSVQDKALSSKIGESVEKMQRTMSRGCADQLRTNIAACACGVEAGRLCKKAMSGRHVSDVADLAGISMRLVQRLINLANIADDPETGWVLDLGMSLSTLYDMNYAKVKLACKAIAEEEEDEYDL